MNLWILRMGWDAYALYAQRGAVERCGPTHVAATQQRGKLNGMLWGLYDYCVRKGIICEFDSGCNCTDKGNAVEWCGIAMTLRRPWRRCSSWYNLR